MSIVPSELILIDNTRVRLAPFEPGNIKELLQFFDSLPKSDLLIYKDDVTKWENIESWFINPRYKKVLDILCTVDERVVAKGTIHSEGLLWSHAAELKLIVHPDYRRKGLGSQLFNILLFEGIRHDYQKIIVRYLEDNVGFRKIISRYGFKPETVLNFYIEDEDSGIHKDLVIASFSMESWSRRFEFYSFLKGR